MTEGPWPQAELSPIARLRVLSAALPGTWVAERVIDVPFDEVWGFTSDLERSAPAFDPDVRALRIVEREGTRLRIRVTAAWYFLGLTFPVEADLRHGFCWMVSRPQMYVVGMAAEPHGEAGTRFAHLEGFAFKMPRLLRVLVRPLLVVSRWRHRHHVPRDIANLARIIQNAS